MTDAQAGKPPGAGSIPLDGPRVERLRDQMDDRVGSAPLLPTLRPSPLKLGDVAASIVSNLDINDSLAVLYGQDIGSPRIEARTTCPGASHGPN